jgi:DMSO/TMAO reductase YedYZ heme-binding membrane subunit
MTTNSHRTRWGLIALLSLLVAGCALAVFAVQADPVAGLRMAIRSTARTSLLLFCAAFGAAALHARWPGAATRWLRANRRELGLSFAASHTMHAAALATLHHVNPGTFATLVNPAMWVLGGLGYVFIAAMALTSTNAAQRAMGANWRRLHLAGGYYLAIGLFNGVIKHVSEGPIYWLMAALVVSVLVLRWTQPRPQGLTLGKV